MLWSISMSIPNLFAEHVREPDDAEEGFDGDDAHDYEDLLAAVS